MGNETWNNKAELRKEWWRKKRLNYNIGLIISGILAFVLSIIIVEFVGWNHECQKSTARISAFADVR